MQTSSAPLLKQTRLLMGMPITVAARDPSATVRYLERVFAYFASVDERFSPHKASSEVSQLNRAELRAAEYSDDLRTILELGERTKRETGGYFDMWHDGVFDPSGIVKGWAISNAAQLLRDAGVRSFYVDAGGDIQARVAQGEPPWRVGIRNPFNRRENVKVLAITDGGVATSGTAVRGQHIYDPHRAGAPLIEIASLTVVGRDVYDADRFATAAFAMGRRGIHFIEELVGLEGYMIDAGGRATFTSGLKQYVV